MNVFIQVILAVCFSFIPALFSYVVFWPHADSLVGRLLLQALGPAFLIAFLAPIMRDEPALYMLLYYLSLVLYFSFYTVVFHAIERFYGTAEIT